MPASRARREAVYVRVPAPDDTAEFHDVTDYVGKTLPFTSPKATCAMRVTEGAVSFSYLQLTKRAVSSLLAKPLDIPRGPLARLDRKAQSLGSELGEGELLVEFEEQQYRFTIERDDNNVIELVTPDDDVELELPKSALQMSLYLRSPLVADRVISVGFIGHLGKPGSPEHVRRVASKILFSLSQLGNFQVLTQIDTVVVPPAPRTAPRPVRSSRRETDRAVMTIPVWLYSPDNPPAPVGHGEVVIEVNLEAANSAQGQLMFEVTPQGDLADVFPPYSQITKSTVATLVRANLGDDDVRAIAVEIVLGEAGASTVQRLRDALGSIAETGLDLTPSMYQLHKG